MQLTAHGLGSSWLAAALALAATSPATPAHADGHGEASASTSVYVDDDAVTVITPAVSGHVTTDDIDVEAAANVDVVSAASVDVVSQATLSTMHERRVEGSLIVTGTPFVRARDLQLGARVVGSTENDYDALTLGGSVRYDALEHDTTLILTYALGLDDVRRTGDDTFSRGRATHRLVATVTQVLDEHTVADLVLDGSYVDGYQANPYRFVPIFAAPGGQRLYSLAERLPDERWTGAALVRIRRALETSPRVYLHADYRFYIDDWGVRSHTASARGIVTVLDDRLQVSLEARVYAQGAAVLYERSYVDRGAGAPAYRTRDRILGGMYSVGAELGAQYEIGGLAEAPAAEVFVAVGLTRFRWLDYALQAGRTALVTTVGANAPF